MTDTSAPKRARSPERIEFLASIVVGAVEHAGYGFIEALEFEWEDEPNTYALIRDRYMREGGYTEAEYLASERRIDLDTAAAGLGVIRRAVLKRTQVRRGHVFLEKGMTSIPPTFGMELHNAKTGQRLYMSEAHRKHILEADRNPDEGDLDVVDYLAIIECAIYGAVVYA